MMPKLWRVKMGALAIYLVIGVLSLTACIFVSLHGDGNAINIDKEYNPSIQLGDVDNDESGTDTGNGNGNDETDDPDDE